MTLMNRLQSKLELDCEIQADDLKRMRKDISKAAAKNDEDEVRSIAKGFRLLEKEHKKASVRLNKVSSRTSTMNDLSASGLSEKYMLEFIQAHNSMTAPLANPRAVQATMGQFTTQQHTMKICQEMMDDALADNSEDEEEEDEESKAVEDIVAQAMNASSLKLLEKLPTISNQYQQPANSVSNSNPVATAQRIQEFLQKK